MESNTNSIGWRSWSASTPFWDFWTVGRSTGTRASGYPMTNGYLDSKMSARISLAHCAFNTVAYLLYVLPYVGLVRTFTRHCCSVISRWLVTTVTLLVAVRHQFTQPAVGIWCLCSDQQYSPPSPLSSPAGTHFSSPPASHSLQSMAAGGGGRVSAGATDTLQTVGHACWIR